MTFSTSLEAFLSSPSGNLQWRGLRSSMFYVLRFHTAIRRMRFQLDYLIYLGSLCVSSREEWRVLYVYTMCTHIANQTPQGKGFWAWSVMQHVHFPLAMHQRLCYREVSELGVIAFMLCLSVFLHFCSKANLVKCARKLREPHWIYSGFMILSTSYDMWQTYGQRGGDGFCSWSVMQHVQFPWILIEMACYAASLSVSLLLLKSVEVIMVCYAACILQSHASCCVKFNPDGHTPNYWDWPKG